MHDVGDTWDIGISLLNNGESEDGKVHSDDASTNRLALTLTGSARSVARVALRKEKADTGWVHDSLLHWETLLVVTTGDLEDVSLEFISNGVTWNLSSHTISQSVLHSMPGTRCASVRWLDVRHAQSSIHRTNLTTTIPKCEIVPLVHEDTELSLIFNLNKLLTAIGREGDVELHCRWSSGSMAEESVAIVD